MGKRYKRTISGAFLLSGLFTVVAFDGLSAPKRIYSKIDETQTFALKGNTRPVVARGLALDEGAVAGSQMMPRMSIHFALTAVQRADRAQLLTAQQDRRSAQFHKFLTPEQYAERFGLDPVDVAKISAWLESSGFVNLEVARSRSWISFNGTAAQAQAAFHTSIHNYLVNGEAHFANASDPLLPKALEGVAQSVRGLHNFRLKAHTRRPKPNFTSSISGNTYLAPDDWTTIYDVKPLYGVGLDGSPIAGETYSLVIVGQSDVNASDLSNFRNAAGLPASTITVVIPPYDRDPGLQLASGDEGESDLDLEWANAIAKNGKILFVTADSDPDNGVDDSIAYAIDKNVAPILSTSYGLCELYLGGEFDTQQDLFAEANAKGMTIVAAAGDDGAADCDSASNENAATEGLAVDYPASSEYVTGVGGTTLAAEGAGTYFAPTNNSDGGSALSYIPEVVWNDGFQSATGGGASMLVSKPAWQAGLGVPNDGHRDVPDIAFTASPNTDGLLFCTPSGGPVTTCVNGTFRNSDSTLNVTGGTSFGPPTMAGILAMLVQHTGSRLGNINPNLYSLAAISETAFHDITIGNNDVVCEGGTPDCPSKTPGVTGKYGYSAGVGYDQTTGWGSLDANNFVEQWSGDIELTADPARLSIAAGSSKTATITVTPYKNFSGKVSFSCSVSSSLAHVTCSMPNSTVTKSGTTTVTISAAKNASLPMLRFRPGTILLLMGFTVAMILAWTRKPKAGYIRWSYGWLAAAVFVVAFGAIGYGSVKPNAAGGGSAPFSLSCNLPATAQVGESYSGSCVAGGGTSPYQYLISAGALPIGLGINSSTGAVTGKPTEAGKSSFTVEATDSGSPALSATQAFSNFVVAPPSETGVVTVTATSGGIVNTVKIWVTVP